MEEQKRTIFPGSFTWIYIIGLVMALAIFGVGLYLAVQQQSWAILAAGCVSLVGVLICWPVAQVLAEFRQMAVSREDEMANVLSDRLQQISVMLNLISEQQLLSDRAKSVAFREKDRDALRRAIQEEVANRDFEAALVLAGDMENVFGYKQEAETLRTEIESARNESVRRQIAEAVAVIDRHSRAESWQDAIKEAQRISAALPGNDVAAKLVAEVHMRREAHKRQLRASLDEAEARGDNDGSIEILKQLDMYLTPQEAEELKERARKIFKQKLQNLGNDFAAAMQANNIDEASRIADEITRDYPNTRIAQEVKERLASARAAEGAPQETAPA